MARLRICRLTFREMGVSLAFVLFGVAACLANAQNDTYWQLRAGEDIVESWHVPLTDSYSHTFQGSYWPDHSWLWQAGAYWLHSLGGFPLLTLVIAAQAVAALALSFTMARGDSRSSLVWLFLSIPLLTTNLSLRPQVTSALLFVILLRLLTRERFIWVPLLFLIWANTHGGVVIGGLVMALTALLALIDWLRSPTPANRLRARQVALAMILGALATFMTPLGTDLWGYVATSLSKAQSSGVQEFESAFRWGGIPVLLFAWCVALVLLTILRGRLLTTWNDRLLLTVSLALVPLALMAIRNIHWLVLASLPALIALSASRNRVEQPSDRSGLHTAVVGGALVIASAAIAGVWTTPARVLGWQPMPTAVVTAVDGCPGPLYNTYNQGGYLIWLNPDVPVFVDSRNDPYPREFLAQHVATGASGDYSSTFARYDIGCAALPPGSPIASALEQDGWRAIAEDSEWVVLYPPAEGPGGIGRRGTAPSARSSETSSR